MPTPLEVAIIVKEKVKLRIPILGRSDNKKIRRDLMGDLTPDQNTQVTLRRAAVTDQLNNVRSHPRNRMFTPSLARPKDILAYGSIVMAAGYGNCFELACAAAFCMSQGAGKELGCDLVCYTGGGDHVFLVIGHPAPPNGDYPQSFANWDANAAVCDAWADIACPATSYPERWRARMQNWQLMGIQIGNVLPTNATWADLVDQTKKSFFNT